MRILDATNLPKLGTIMAAAALVGAGTSAMAADVGTSSEGAYEWSAQMVDFDEAAGTLTAKARVEGYAQIEGLDGFAEGERLTLVWTGRSWAAGIRDIGPSPEIPEGALSLPIEFVASTGDYVTFRVPVPANSVERIGELQPGDRITAHSPRGQTPPWESAVISMRHYNDVE